MLETLRLVRGTVSDREGIASVLTHFHIREDVIYGSNGRLTLEAPFPNLFGGTAVTVPADPFLKAVDACQGEPKMDLDDEGGKLKIHRGRFRATLPLSKEPFELPAEIETGDIFDITDGDYLQAIRRIRPFVSDDASRPWAMGVLHDSGALYATNNIVIARTRAENFPHVNVPSFALDEVLRIGRTPQHLWMNETAVGYDFGDGLWLRSILYNAPWPNVADMFEGTRELQEIDDQTRQIVDQLIPFCVDGKFPIIQFEDGCIKTLEGDMQAEIEVDADLKAAFHATPLMAVLKVATQWNLSPYPNPCPWSGDKIDGLVVGVRV